MENLKDYLKRKEQEAEDRFEKATTGRDQESAFSARDTLTDVLIKLKETQRGMLEQIAVYTKHMTTPEKQMSGATRNSFYNKIVGMMSAYRIIFGLEELGKITDSPGQFMVESKKIRKVLEDLR